VVIVVSSIYNFHFAFGVFKDVARDSFKACFRFGGMVVMFADIYLPHFFCFVVDSSIDYDKDIGGCLGIIFIFSVCKKGESIVVWIDDDFVDRVG